MRAAKQECPQSEKIRVLAKWSVAHRESHGAQQEHHRVQQALTVYHHLQQARNDSRISESSSAHVSKSRPDGLLTTDP